MRVMGEAARGELGEEDRAFITRRVGELVQPGPGASEAMVVADDCQGRRGGEGAKQMRFQRFDRVVCRLGGQPTWASGTVQLHAVDVDADDNAEDHRTTGHPCVHVMLNAPDSRLIAVPEDGCHPCNGLPLAAQAE